MATNCFQAEIEACVQSAEWLTAASKAAEHNLSEAVREKLAELLEKSEEVSVESTRLSLQGTILEILLLLEAPAHKSKRFNY